MKRTLLFWAAGFLLIAIGWKVIEACSCAPKHLQIQYCESDFVILVVPTRKKVIAGSSITEYTVKLKKIIKANSAARKALRKRKIYTDPVQCGVIMNTFLTYILIGNVYNGKPEIGMCLLNYVWNDLPHEILDQLRRLKHACSCTIDICDFPVCNKTESTCVYNKTFTNSFECYNRFGVCSRNKWGECDWVRSRNSTRYSALAECLNTTIAYV